MDVTGLFLATVKMVKTRNKALDASPAMARQRLRETCHFTQQAKAIVKDVTHLRDFLLSHRKDYINVDHVLDGASSLSDYERDQIDTQSQTILKTCTYVLKNLRNSVRLEKCSTQRYQHRQEMVEMVSAYLAAVAKIYGEQKAIRVNRVVDMKKLYRLENMIKFIETTKKRNQTKQDALQATSPTHDPKEPMSSRKTTPVPENRDAATPTASRSASPPSPMVRRRLVGAGGAPEEDKVNATTPEEAEKHKPTEILEEKQVNKKLVALEEDVRRQEEEWKNYRSTLDENERKQLTVEKEQMMDELRGMADEIQLLEGKVMEIAQLQDIFTTKVLEQEQDIIRINEVAIHTTENIKAGNESIREAMKKKAGFRVWILFFLLVMSFTLLFLDWYNP